MCSSYRSFLQLNKSKTERVEKQIPSLECKIGCLRQEIQNIEAEASEWYLHECREKLSDTILALECCRRELRDLDRINPERTGNSDNAVAEFIYLQWNYTKKLEIDVRSLPSCHSLTTIPDLSYFTGLQELILDGHENMCGGLDRIPPTVKILSLFRAGFKSCDEIVRITNLEKLSLQRNYGITEVPDLSGMKHLIILNVAQTGIKHLPNLPDGLHLIDFPCTVSGLSRLEKRDFLHPSEMNVLRMDVYGGIFFGPQKTETMRRFIHKVRKMNQFRKIREELLENAARISMHPKRIARLLESGLDFDDLEDRDNLFGFTR